MVNGFFDVENRLDYLTACGDILPTLKKLIPGEKFRGELEVIYAHDQSKTRSRIEHVFGAMAQRAGNVIPRIIGVKVAEVMIGLQNLAYNTVRYCTLKMQAA